MRIMAWMRVAWLTQKTHDPKSNKENLTFPTHTVNVIELNCKVIKKWQSPHFQVYLLF